MSAKENVLLFGATGLVGSEIMDYLLTHRANDVSLRIFVRTKIENENRVEQFIGDITDQQAVNQACVGMDTAIQTVAVINWSPKYPKILYNVNVTGNGYVLAACIKHGITKFIFTSSIDVVFGGKAISQGDETLPYPKKYLDHYSHSKSIAEQEVLAANGSIHHKGVLRTCSLRTAGIYGGNDRVRLPTIIQAVKDGKYLRMGNGKAKFNHVYAGNVAYAHVKAMDALHDPNSPVAGQAYFITDWEPTNFFDHIEEILVDLGYSPSQKSIPCWILNVIAVISEGWASLVKPKNPPLITRYTVKANCDNFNFVSTKASQDMGYEPIISKSDAIRLTVARLRARGFANES